MAIMGFLAFLDPQKESTESAINIFKEYRVSVKNLTGDNKKVTTAICKKVGIKVNTILGNKLQMVAMSKVYFFIKSFNL